MEHPERLDRQIDQELDLQKGTCDKTPFIFHRKGVRGNVRYSRSHTSMKSTPYLVDNCMKKSQSDVFSVTFRSL
jgi:hypothetical protein